MMAYHVLQIFTVVSMLSLLSCNYYQNPPKGDGWQFPFFTSMHEKRFGNQMPPHHEPDAVLINVNKNGPPIFPGGYPSVPGGPRIFGNPRGFPGGPGHPRGPVFPNVFGFSGFDIRPGITGPGMFGISGGSPRILAGPAVSGNSGVPPILGRPGVFDISRSVLVPNAFQNPRDPKILNEPGMLDMPTGASQTPGGFGMWPSNWFGIAQDSGFQNEPRIFGLPGHGISNNPAVFFRWGEQGGPFIPKEPDITGVPGQLGPFPGEPAFRTPNIFSGAGGGNVPFPAIPWFFMPRENPNVPNPGRKNEFDFGGIYPNTFIPESPFLPDQPENTNHSGAHSPRRDVKSGSGERETHDDPTEDMLPITDRSLQSKVPN